MVKKLIKFERDTITMDGISLNPNDISQRLGMGPKGTRIFIKNLDTGEQYETHNMVLLDGGMWTAAYHWGLDEIIKLPSYNEDMGLDTPGDVASESQRSPARQGNHRRKREGKRTEGEERNAQGIPERQGI